MLQYLTRFRSVAATYSSPGCCLPPIKVVVICSDKPELLTFKYLSLTPSFYLTHYLKG